VPMQDNLESGNQSMMIAEGWKDAVLRWLQVPSRPDLGLISPCDLALIWP